MIKILQNMLTYLWFRGICTNLCYPFGYHASMGFTGDQLHPLVWEAMRV